MKKTKLCAWVLEENDAIIWGAKLEVCVRLHFTSLSSHHFTSSRAIRGNPSVISVCLGADECLISSTGTSSGFRDLFEEVVKELLLLMISTAVSG